MNCGAVFKTASPFPWQETFLASRLEGKADSPEPECGPDLYNAFCCDKLYIQLVEQTRILGSRNEYDLLRSQLAPPVDDQCLKFIDPVGAGVLRDIDAELHLSLGSDFVHLAGRSPGFAEYVMARQGFYCRGSIVPANDHFSLAGPHAWPATGMYFPVHCNLVTGPCGLSDIRRLPSREFIVNILRRRHPQGLSVFVADTQDPDGQPDEFALTGECGETEHLPWLAAEIWILLHTLQRGGSAVLKLFHWFLPSTVELLWLLSGLFEQVRLTRSRHCVLGSADTYFVGLKFRGLPAEQTKALATLLNARVTRAPYEPLFDLNQLTQVAEFTRFRKDLILVRATALTQFRIKCLRYLRQQNTDALAQCLLRFYGATDDFLSQEFVYSKPSVLAGSSRSVSVQAFLKSLRVKTPGALLLAALIPELELEDEENKDEEPRKQHPVKKPRFEERQFLFCGDGQAMELQSPKPRILDPAYQRLMSDYSQVLAPGTIIEVGHDAGDFVNLRLLDIVMMPQENLGLNMADQMETMLSFGRGKRGLLNLHL